MSGPIIVGVDGSATAQKAAEKACELALKLDAPLHVVSAHTKDEIAHVNFGGEEFVLSHADEANDTAAKAAKDLRHTGADITVAAAQGKPSEALIAYAERTGAQMIVVGNRRMRGMSRVLGSVANSVSHSATCDVYIAHTSQR
ncbi:hypothetical protein GCM10023354_15990 [Garicola koreensis]|uniref:universal stress protein n=1 Tax=Garicola koreensis TaxID=1262554 RepID=UPI0031E4F07B